MNMIEEYIEEYMSTCDESKWEYLMRLVEEYKEEEDDTRAI